MKKALQQFLLIWVGISFTLLVCVLLQQTLWGRIVGASPEEIDEAYDLVSVPLGFVSHWFVIRSQTGILRACVVLVANSYFYALVLFPVVKFVRHRLQRNQPIALHLGESEEERQSKKLSDEDELL